LLEAMVCSVFCSPFKMSSMLQLPPARPGDGNIANAAAARSAAPTRTAIRRPVAMGTAACLQGPNATPGSGPERYIQVGFTHNAGDRITPTAGFCEPRANARGASRIPAGDDKAVRLH
jgi:hypothetical protein